MKNTTLLLILCLPFLSIAQQTQTILDTIHDTEFIDVYLLQEGIRATPNQKGSPRVFKIVFPNGKEIIHEKTKPMISANKKKVLLVKDPFNATYFVSFIELFDSLKFSVYDEKGELFSVYDYYLPNPENLLPRKFFGVHLLNNGNLLIRETFGEGISAPTWVFYSPKATFELVDRDLSKLPSVGYAEIEIFIDSDNEIIFVPLICNECESKVQFYLFDFLGNLLDYKHLEEKTYAYIDSQKLLPDGSFEIVYVKNYRKKDKCKIILKTIK